ncbi:MAG TPA: substrate-binding domain-containing protein [Vicinamibacterales bacterium]|nr:substrate-binding domain-containing protein [Vicinamibacterales bacterium]HOQ59459.1 substrate-binding domain-containing protein [Vicinamibacterales bacterium]
MKGLALALFLLAVAHAAAAQIPPPSHEPPPGVVRVWGHAQARNLVRRWAASFETAHPGVRIDARLTGSDIGFAGLYTGQADIALVGREATDSETKAFEWVFRYKPASVQVMTGSLDRAGRSPAIVVFVHRHNPLERLSLAQLAAIFGHGEGPLGAIRTWGQLGLTGTWADAPIRLYAPMAESGTGRAFRARVLGGSTKMNWDHLREFADEVSQPDGIDTSGARIAAALASDRYGLALSNLGSARPELKPIALASAGDGEYCHATRVNVIDRRYPLARSIYAYVNQRPGVALAPSVRLFLKHILSDHGQAVVSDYGYLRLNARILAEQRRLVDR